MEKEIKYQILASNTLANLEAHVNNEMRYGWAPTGGLITYRLDSTDMLAPAQRYFAQAMIKCPTGK